MTRTAIDFKQKTKENFFGIAPSSPEWIIKETSFGLDEQHIQESLFTLGNGFIGSRGVLEELPERAMPGTFIAGVYDKSGAQTEELVNLPNPIHFIFVAEGEKLDMNFMGFLEHTRYLDMRQGILMRRTIFKDSKHRKYLYKSLRFFSMYNPHIAWMKISLTLLNGKAELTALDVLDDTVTNYGGLIYGSRRHIRLMDIETRDHINYYAYKTLSSKTWISYADYLSMEKNGESKILDDRVYNFELKEGETITFSKVFSIQTSLQQHASQMKNNTLNGLTNAVSIGFEEILKRHTDEWKNRWNNSDISIKGDSLCDKALRLNIYHLLIAGHKGAFHAGIGARALTGQGYKGHIFWDAEIFILPFYSYIDPAVARNMLLYRYYRLKEARKNAERKGYEGALFPWESASIGDDVTPRYAKDVDGTVIKMNTMDFEQHTSADIAYAVFNYYRATGDAEFLYHQGAELVFETARFWASRASFNNKRKKYEILNVTGPDEFHPQVNNDVYTSLMAAWNLSYAAKLYDELKEKRIEDSINKVKIHDREIEKWKDISGNIYISKPKQKNIIEQFSGFLKKRNVTIKNYNNYFMPESPRHISYEEFSKTQYLKQPDLLLLFYLLPEKFSAEEKLKNYRYYINRTLHQSSLSYSIHSLVASKLGDGLRAYAFFLFAAQLDLKNFHNNTDAGIHMANAGGVWQAAVFGLAGIFFEGETLGINPRLPKHWKSISFNLFWRGCLLKFRISGAKVKITNYPVNSNQKSITVKIFDETHNIESFKSVEVSGKRGGGKVKRIKDIMKPENLVCADENVTVKKINHLLLEKDVSCITIIDMSGELRGIISEKDILKIAEQENFSQLKAKDIMKTDVEYVKEDDHVEVALRLFTERPFRALPVLRGKTVVGIIKRKDILSVCSGEMY